MDTSQFRHPLSMTARDVLNPEPDLKNHPEKKSAPLRDPGEHLPKILILAGIQEELAQFLKEHPFEFNKEFRAYRSRLYGNLYAATTGPGLSRRKDIRKLILKLEPDLIINAGLVGVLDERDTLKVGDRLRLGSVIDSRNSIIYPGRPGKDVLVTVPTPVFEPLEKINLYLEFKARACDMESARLIGMVGTSEKLMKKTRIILCKVCGDLPDDYSLFKHEHLIRGWRRADLKEKFKMILSFPGGPLSLRRLLFVKKTGLESLTTSLHRLLKQILDSGGRTDNIDSLFIPS